MKWEATTQLSSVPFFRTEWAWTAEGLVASFDYLAFSDYQPHRKCCCCSIITLCLTLCNPMDCSTQGSSVLHHHLDITIAQIHALWVSDAIKPSHPLLPPSPFTFNFFLHQGFFFFFQWVISSHQVAKVVELQLQHQSFQRIDRADPLPVQWILKSLLQYHSSKASVLGHSAFSVV